jgi:branched-subunit amino acid transport protein
MRSEAAYWLIIVGMGLTTLAIRLSMILLLGRVHLPESVVRGLRFVPPAVFSALIAPALVRPQGAIELSASNPYLLAGLLAAATAWRFRSMLLTIAAGMGALLLLR